MNRLKVKKVKVVNMKEVDIYVRDAFGVTHIIFPKQEKKILMIQEEKKDGICRD